MGAKKLAQEIIELEIRRDKILNVFMGNMKKTIKKWSIILDIDSFKHTIKNLHVEHMLSKGGTNYFAWTNEDAKQRNFEIFVGKMLNNKRKYFHYPEVNRLFNLKVFYMMTTSRSSVEMETYHCEEVGGKDILIYKYSGTAYHGFGSIDVSVVQELRINMETSMVEYYKDSEETYDSGIRILNTDFIDKLLERKTEKS